MSANAAATPSGPIHGTADGSSGVAVARDIAYTTSGHPKHKLDVYFPAMKGVADRRLPVVFFVHGGGWQRGDRQYRGTLYGNVGAAFATRGFVSVVISYRLSNPSLRMVGILNCIFSAIVSGGLAAGGVYIFSPHWVAGLVLWLLIWCSCVGARFSCFRRDAVEYPAHVEDCCAALDWVVGHIADYGGDPNRIILSGHSAGAHIVAIMGLNPRYRNPAVRGVIGISGPYSMEKLAASVVARLQYMHSVFGRDATRWAEMFPNFWARKADPAVTPPFLLFNASVDLALRPHAEELRDALRARGVTAEMPAEVHCSNHISIIGAISPASAMSGNRVMDESVAFIHALALKEATSV